MILTIHYIFIQQNDFFGEIFEIEIKIIICVQKSVEKAIKTPTSSGIEKQKSF